MPCKAKGKVVAEPGPKPTSLLLPPHTASFGALKNHRNGHSLKNIKNLLEDASRKETRTSRAHPFFLLPPGPVPPLYLGLKSSVHRIPAQGGEGPGVGVLCSSLGVGHRALPSLIPQASDPGCTLYP